MVKRWCAMVLAGAAVLGTVGVAEACNCGNWCPETLMDSWSSIPANTPGFPLAIRSNNQGDYIMPRWIFTDVNRSTGYPIQIVNVDNVPGGFEFLDSRESYLIQTAQELEPSTYVLSSPDSTCGLLDGHTLSVFNVTPAVPFPTDLGGVSMSDHSIINLNVISVDGCDLPVSYDAVAIHLSVDLSREAEPWRDAFFFTTWVDGERWRERRNICDQPSLGEESGGRGFVQLFTLCGQSPAGLEPGRHTVKFTAWLPGTDIVLETEEVEFELDCTELEAQLAAANPGDGAPYEGEATSADEEDAGCNVSSPSGGTSGGWLGLGLAGLGVWAGLRRR